MRIASQLATAHFVVFAWVFFRATTLANAWEVLGRIASLTASLANISMPLAVVLLIGATMHYLPRKVYDLSTKTFVRAPFYAQATALVLLVLAIEYIAVTGAAPFLYTKF